MKSVRVFQVAYDQARVYDRARLLRQHGCHVQSVIGNDAAKVMLSGRPYYDVFIIGSDGPEEMRREMVRWLRRNYPGQRILDLNPTANRKLDGLKYNARTDSPSEWLQLIEGAASSRR